MKSKKQIMRLLAAVDLKADWEPRWSDEGLPQRENPAEQTTRIVKSDALYEIKEYLKKNPDEMLDFALEYILDLDLKKLQDLYEDLIGNDWIIVDE